MGGYRLSSLGFTSMTLSSDACGGMDSAASFAPFSIERTLSGDISEAPSFTFADAVILVGRPDTVISLSKSKPTAYALFCGGILSIESCRSLRESDTMCCSFFCTAFRTCCSCISWP